MVNPEHDRLRRLFDLVLAAAEAERPALLQRLCGADPGLRRRLEAMIAAVEDDRFLTAPTGDEAARASESGPAASLEVDALREGPGTRIGPYKLLQQIGEGGFGVVFLAEQEKPVARRVALKIIKLGMDTRQVVARFEQERQALALMDHPNIARVIDAGATETGRPYFVMELVKGEPIALYCDRNNLSIDERLRLFAQVCNAVQHAHGKGIIHRDLKPSNVLVGTHDGIPHAKVIDFGIAKATSAKLTDKTLFTEHQQVIGTLQYMSPEQAEGSLDIDTRTDVYALGVVLYELLTGSTPFDAKTFHDAFYSEIQRIIREVEPPKPSTRLNQSADSLASIAARRRVAPKRLGVLVRGELDWIVMKALEKDRARRYQTASGFSDDVLRFLNGEAVEAAPPSAAYRFSKFVRRNRGKVIAGAAVAASLLVGLIGFAWQAHVAQGERDRALVARAAEAEQRAEAEKQRSAAEASARAEKARAVELSEVSDFQAKMLSQIDTTDAGIRMMRDLRERFASALAKTDLPEADRVAGSDGFARDLLRVNATDAATELIDRTILAPAVAAATARFRDQPIVDASLRQTLASLYTTLGRYEAAAPLQAFALETRRKLLGDEHPETMRSVNDAGDLLDSQGKFAEAEPFYREACDVRRRVLGADSPDTIVSMGNLGTLLMELGRFSDAEPYVRESLERARRVLGNEHRDTLIRVNVMGYLLVDQGRPKEAEPYWREAYETGKRVLGPNDKDTLVWTNNMGGLLDSLGRPAEAEVFYREALEGTRRARGEDHPGTLSCMQNLAQLLRNAGRYAEAEALGRDSLAARLRVLGPDHPDTLSSQSLLGDLLTKEGRLAEAEPLLRGALQSRRRVLGDAHPDTISSTMRLARLLVELDRLAEAESVDRSALEISSAVWGKDHPDRLILMNHLGGILIRESKYTEAEPFVREVLETRRRVSGVDHPETLIALYVWAVLLEDQGKLAEAEAPYRDAVDRFRRVLGNDHPNTMRSLLGLGGILRALGRSAEAEPLDREAAAGFARILGPEHPDVGGACRELARALTGLKRFGEAETELAAAEHIDSTSKDVSVRTRRARAKDALVLYEAWDLAEPDGGHAEKVAEWKAKLAALAEPAPSGEKH